MALRRLVTVPEKDRERMGLGYSKLWEEPLRGQVAGTTERSAAVRRIAGNHLETVNGFSV